MSEHDLETVETVERLHALDKKVWQLRVDCAQRRGDIGFHAAVSAQTAAAFLVGTMGCEHLLRACIFPKETVFHSALAGIAFLVSLVWSFTARRTKRLGERTAVEVLR